MLAPRPPAPPDLSALPEPLRRRFLRLARTFATGLFLAMMGATVAALWPGLPRRAGFAVLVAGVLVAGGAFVYGVRVGRTLAPPRVAPPGSPPGEDAPP